jgi:hypothetical protein
MQTFESLQDVSHANVLIIDEEVDLCLLMKAFFLRKHCAVYIAHTVRDALRVARNTELDVILLDRGLCTNPDYFIHRLREEAPNASIFPTGEPKEKEDLVPWEKFLELLRSNEFFTLLLALICLLIILKLRMAG